MEGNKFEEAHRRLGELLGSDADNSDSDAAPDPWWISAGKLCIVSEDKSDSKPDNPVAVKHVRQAVTHPTWIREHVKLAEKPFVVCVMITPATSIHPEAATFADELKYWQIDEFRKWAAKAVATVRELRNEYPGPGNLGWRIAVCNGLRHAKLDPISVFEQIAKMNVKSLPIKGGKETEPS